MNKTLSKVFVFLLTFLGYAGLHCLREGWSFSKPQLIMDMNVSKRDLGLIDTFYLVSYSLGMCVLSSLFSKFSLKTYIVIGIFFSAIFYVTFSIVYMEFGFFSVALMGVLMCLNGFMQATGMPGLMGIMSNWFESDKKGLLMGIWAMNANVGNILASITCNVLQNNGAKWTINFIITASFTLFITLHIIVFLQENPTTHANEIAEHKPIINTDEYKSLEYYQPNNPEKLNTKPFILSEKEQNLQSEKPKSLNVFRALLLPRVPFYVMGYACVKACIYALLFWLPNYLEERNLNEERGFIASMIDVGSLIGGITVGILTDKFNRRAVFLSPLLFAASLVMFTVSFVDMKEAWMYYITMFLVGMLIGGPYNIIGTAIAIDLAEQTGTNTNVVPVTSLIHGSAALFAAISQMVISIMPSSLIFYLFAGFCLVASVALAPLLCKEIQEIRLKNEKK